MSYISYDITFCSRECGNKSCVRNLKYIDKKDLFKVKPLISVSTFDKCKDYINIESEK